jgi:bisphosphoglycerate-dependent phosphoglycerate mutase
MLAARIYIVRHGETEENRQGTIQGQLDTLLNVTGLAQSEAVAKALQSIPFEKAYSSDLRRAAKVCISHVVLNLAAPDAHVEECRDYPAVPSWRYASTTGGASREGKSHLTLNEKHLTLNLGNTVLGSTAGYVVCLRSFR